MPEISALVPKNSMLGLYASPGRMGGSYAHRVLNTRRANLIAYWPLWEQTGTSIRDISRQANHGALIGATLNHPGIGDGHPCPSFDGTTSCVNIYSAALNADFTPREFTLMLWLKVANAGVWVDGAQRGCFSLRVNANNRVLLLRGGVNNQVTFLYAANGTTKTVAYTTTGPLGFFCLALTVSVAADQFKAYFNGAQVGTTQTGLGGWVGSLVSNSCTIGAATTGDAAGFVGYGAHCALWDTPLTPSEIGRISEV